MQLPPSLAVTVLAPLSWSMAFLHELSLDFRPELLNNVSCHIYCELHPQFRDRIGSCPVAGVGGRGNRNGSCVADQNSEKLICASPESPCSGCCARPARRDYAHRYGQSRRRIGLANNHYSTWIPTLPTAFPITTLWISLAFLTITSPGSVGGCPSV